MLLHPEKERKLRFFSALLTVTLGKDLFYSWVYTSTVFKKTINLVANKMYLQLFFQ